MGDDCSCSSYCCFAGEHVFVLQRLLGNGRCKVSRWCIKGIFGVEKGTWFLVTFDDCLPHWSKHHHGAPASCRHAYKRTLFFFLFITVKVKLSQSNNDIKYRSDITIKQTNIRLDQTLAKISNISSCYSLINNTRCRFSHFKLQNKFWKFPEHP